jgi:hypothetical protein
MECIITKKCFKEIVNYRGFQKDSKELKVYLNDYQVIHPLKHGQEMRL